MLTTDVQVTTHDNMFAKSTNAQDDDVDDSLIFLNGRGCRVAKVSTVVDVGVQVGSVWVVNELTDVNP